MVALVVALYIGPGLIGRLITHLREGKSGRADTGRLPRNAILVVLLSRTSEHETAKHFVAQGRCFVEYVRTRRTYSIIHQAWKFTARTSTHTIDNERHRPTAVTHAGIRADANNSFRGYPTYSMGKGELKGYYNTRRILVQ